jgi:hypothetical protein
MQSSTEIYSQRVDRFRLMQLQYKRQLLWLSIGRFLFFVAFVWLIIVYFRSHFVGPCLLYGLLCFALFLGFVLLSVTVNRKRRFAQQLLLINDNEIQVADGKASFLDDGTKYRSKNGVLSDLDVFGPNSLFHLLNRTGSVSGKQALMQRLSSPFTLSTDIIQYQECIRELADKIDFRQTLLAESMLFKEEEALEQLQSGIIVSHFRVFDSLLWRLLGIVWPIGGLVVTLYSISQDRYQWMLLYMVLGWGVLGTILKKINILYGHISKRSYLYNQYAKSFQLINTEKCIHPYLQEKQQQTRYAAKAFERLAGLTGVFDLRMSLFSPFINGLFLFDLLCAKSYLRWNHRYQSQVKTWFDTLGEIELLNSLASFHFNHPAFIFPQPMPDSLSVKATGVGHPLMSEKKAVLNDVSIGDPCKLQLITGSNMSGKSTYLRTIGLNVLLAQLGAPVFATSFVFAPLRLLTSFHHIDSLEESTSYFYAELKCLQQIIGSLDKPVPALVLLDEVMRGTNSKDKHEGTALLIKKLLDQNCLSLIATHDTELGVLATSYPGQIENFCFESELTEKGLHFDFKRRSGIAQTKNATYLMRQMGII